MRGYPRPRILISACLEFEEVRYNGKIVSCPTVRDLIPFADFIKVCPECEIGLGVPRDSLRIVNIGGQERLIQPRIGRDVTEAMDAFTDHFIASLPPVDGFLFKSGSPTIGFFNIKVYDHPAGAGVTGRTSGLFARKIMRNYPCYPMEDDLRLKKRKIRDEFLTKVFAFAGFREAADTGDWQVVREFHERNKYLFFSYGPDGIPGLERALAIEDRAGYFNGMRRLLSRPGTTEIFERLALFIFGRYENRLSARETAWFGRLMEKFRKNKVSRDGLLEALEMFAVRMSDREMTGQTLFAPYPQELVPDADEDQDRDYWKVKGVS